MSRATTTIILAVVLILIVMGITSTMAYAGTNIARYNEQPVWSQSFGDAQSMKMINLTGDQTNELFVQNTTSVAVYDAAGKQLFSQDFASPFTTTLGDVNGDRVEDIIVFSPNNLTALDGTGKTLMKAELSNVSTPQRAAVVRFAGGTQIALGDQDGQLVGLGLDGKELWRTQLSQGDYIRGLDEAQTGGANLLAAANHDGTIGLYDAAGKQRWEYQLGGPLRRMRTFDLNGDKNGQIVAGGDNGRLVILDAAEGNERASVSFGQTIVEIRDGELDGNPSGRELVVGGKDGGVAAYHVDGSKLWSRSVSARVSEIALADVSRTGAEDVIIGTEDGTLRLFNGPDGSGHDLPQAGGAVTRLDVGRLTASRQLAIANNSDVKIVGLDRQAAPFWYSPLLIGALLSVVVAGVAWFVATMPAKPVLRGAAEDQSVEGLQSRRVMLHESLADVERLRSSGEMPGDAYLARLRELREDLAETEAGLLKAKASFKPETMRCPNCGGALPLGIDRCEYCGAVVIK